jgi:hypothetical protein
VPEMLAMRMMFMFEIKLNYCRIMIKKHLNSKYGSNTVNFVPGTIPKKPQFATLLKSP